MINLIPPTARTAVTREYWMRVIVVWVFLLSLAMAVVVVLLVPSYVLLHTQLTAYSTQYTQAQLHQNDFEQSERLIKDTNILARHLNTVDQSVPFSALITELDATAGSGIGLTQFTFARTAGEVTGITITGVATTRSALATFSDRVVANDLFVEANVPISNLAKDSDITFTIDVVPAPAN